MCFDVLNPKLQNCWLNNNNMSENFPNYCPKVYYHTGDNPYRPRVKCDPIFS